MFLQEWPHHEVVPALTSVEEISHIIFMGCTKAFRHLCVSLPLIVKVPVISLWVRHQVDTLSSQRSRTYLFDATANVKHKRIGRVQLSGGSRHNAR